MKACFTDYPDLQKVIFEALSELYLVKPSCPIEYLGYWLLDFNKKTNEIVKRREMVEELAHIKEPSCSNSFSVNVAADDDLEKFLTVRHFLNNTICDILVENVRFGATTAWVGMILASEFLDKQEMLIICADKKHVATLEGKKLLATQGVWWALHVGNDEKLYIEDVTLDERIYFFGIPRFGSLLLVKLIIIRPESETHFHVAWQLRQEKESHLNVCFKKSMIPLLSDRLELLVAVDNLGSDCVINQQEVVALLKLRREQWESLQLLRLERTMETYEITLAHEKELTMAYYRLPSPPEIRRYETDIDALKQYYKEKMRRVAQLIEFYKSYNIVSLVRQLAKMDIILFIEVFKCLFHFARLPLLDSWRELREQLEEVVLFLVSFDPTKTPVPPYRDEQMVDSLKASLAFIKKGELEAFSFTLLFLYELLRECIEGRISYVILNYFENKKDDHSADETQIEQNLNNTTENQEKNLELATVVEPSAVPNNSQAQVFDISANGFSLLISKYNI